MHLEDHSAAGASAGFSYQFERALYWLASSPSGFVIGIETDDDVARRGPDGSALLEQDKHSIDAHRKPFGDRSKDLWNTLATWVDAVHMREVPDETRFLMVTNKELPECIAKQINRAQSHEEIAACVGALEHAGISPPLPITPLVDSVLRQEARTSLNRVIRQCELVDASAGAPSNDSLELTIAHLQLPKWCKPTADSIANELLGWLHHTVLRIWRAKRPAWIRRDDFVEHLHAILDHRRRQISRERAEYLIPVPDETVGEKRANRFVKQLHLITDDNDLVDTAIRDFIRCNIEKGRLSTEGNVTDDDWKAFESTLRSRWSRIRARLIRMRNAVPDKDTGFEIFTETTEDYRERLAGSETEQVYLTSGTYHRLADLMHVGWHPKFDDLLK